MGHSEGKSMLYLEARCLLVTRGAGSQGSQNGSISCVALPESLPGGVRMHGIEHYLRLVEKDELDLTALITHHFPLERYREAFLTMHSKARHAAVKGVFTFEAP